VKDGRKLITTKTEYTIDLLKSFRSHILSHLRMDIDMASESMRLLFVTSENPFGANNFSLLTGESFRSSFTGNCERFECSFGAMMVIIAAQYIHVESNASSLAEALQAVRYHLSCQSANFGIFEAKMTDEKWPGRDIEDSSSQSLI
jgi:hypothetical protein